MIIDVFCHITPQKYKEALFKKAPTFPIVHEVLGFPPLWDLDTRFRIMDRYDRYGGLLQVLTLMSPAVEAVVGPKDAAELAKIANDEMAELVYKYPDRFPGAVACLPMNDMEAALKETERAITQLKFRGVQIFTSVRGEPIDNPKFMPLYEKMCEYNLPIWLHPRREGEGSVPDYPSEDRSKYNLLMVFGWPYETSLAMGRLVCSGTMEKYPDLKVITHHCGGTVPMMEGRIIDNYDLNEIRFRADSPYTTPLKKRPIDYYRKFYADTAVWSQTDIECGYKFFGSDHILFGSDGPLDTQFGDRSMRINIDAIEHMDIDEADKKKIYRDNAWELLRLSI